MVYVIRRIAPNTCSPGPRAVRDARGVRSERRPKRTPATRSPSPGGPVGQRGGRGGGPRSPARRARGARRWRSASSVDATDDPNARSASRVKHEARLGIPYAYRHLYIIHLRVEDKARAEARLVLAWPLSFTRPLRHSSARKLPPERRLGPRPPRAPTSGLMARRPSLHTATREYTQDDVLRHGRVARATSERPPSWMEGEPNEIERD